MRQAGAQITTSDGMLFQLQGAYFQARDLQSACVILRVRVTQSMHRVRTSREGKEETTTQTLLPVRHSVQ